MTLAAAKWWTDVAAQYGWFVIVVRRGKLSWLLSRLLVMVPGLEFTTKQILSLNFDLRLPSY